LTHQFSPQIVPHPLKKTHLFNGLPPEPHIHGFLLDQLEYLINVWPIRHNEPPHVNSPDVASGTVARRLRIDVHDNANDDDDNDNA